MKRRLTDKNRQLELQIVFSNKVQERSEACAFVDGRVVTVAKVDLAIDKEASGV